MRQNAVIDIFVEWANIYPFMIIAIVSKKGFFLKRRIYNGQWKRASDVNRMPLIFYD